MEVILLVEVLLDEHVHVVAHVHEVEEAVSRDFVPDGMALVVLAVRLSRVDVHRLIDIDVRLLESSE